MATQLPNGYIGNYAPEYQLQQWDVWGRKYTSLGLIAWYDLSGDKKALEAACRVVDHLMTARKGGYRLDRQLHWHAELVRPRTCHVSV